MLQVIEIFRIFPTLAKLIQIILPFHFYFHFWCIVKCISWLWEVPLVDESVYDYDQAKQIAAWLVANDRNVPKSGLTRPSVFPELARCLSNCFLKSFFFFENSLTFGNYLEFPTNPVLFMENDYFKNRRKIVDPSENSGNVCKASGSVTEIAHKNNSKFC